MADPIDDDETDEELQRAIRESRRQRQVAAIKASAQVLRMLETAEGLKMNDPAVMILTGNAISMLERLARAAALLAKEMPTRKRKRLDRIEVVRIPLPDPPKQIEELAPDPPPGPEAGEPPAPEATAQPEEARAVTAEIVVEPPPAKSKSRFELALDLVMGVRTK